MVKVKLIYIATLYLSRFVTGLRNTQSVIHLCTMQSVGSCGDDTSISNTGVCKFFFHVWASFRQNGPGDLTASPIVFVCCVNDHVCLRRLKKYMVNVYCKASDEENVK